MLSGVLRTCNFMPIHIYAEIFLLFLVFGFPVFLREQKHPEVWFLCNF